MSGFKIGAAACCFMYLLAFLLLPFVMIVILPVLGSQLLSTIWGWIVLAAGLTMGACAILADGKIASIVSAVGALVPLIVFFIAPGEILASFIPAELGIRQLAGSVVSIYAVRIGAGVILTLLLGIASAVLCFLSEQNRKPRNITAGLGAETDDDW